MKMTESELHTKVAVGDCEGAKEETGAKGWKQAEPHKYEDRALVEDEKFYLTTAIAYLNGPPHVGHAYEFVTSDAIARYHRVCGRNTHFCTGSDDHGQKVKLVADKLGKDPKSFTDEIVKEFHKLNAALELDEHQYIRTTDEHHKRFATWLWRRVEARGDIYLSRYSGWYSVTEESFVTERDAEANGFKDPLSGKPYERQEEECHFFRLSKYHDWIYNLIEKDSTFCEPNTRKNEFLGRLRKAKLEDLCVSRNTLKWGIPVPSDPRFVMYVWFDALTNYISAIWGEDDVAHDTKDIECPWPTQDVEQCDTDQGDESDGKFKEGESVYNSPSVTSTQLRGRENTKLPGTDANPSRKYWPADLHILGKDVAWFHHVIWPCMLRSAGLPLPRQVFGHGWVIAEDGRKMGKSLGNAVSPMEALALTGSDSFRYYLIRGGHYGADFKYSEAAFIDTHNADLCSTIGNLVHRAVALAVKSCDGVIPDISNTSEDNETNPELNLSFFDAAAAFTAAEKSMFNVALEDFALIGLNICKETNKYLTDEAPWKLKGESEQMKKKAVIRAVLEAVYVAAHYLYPVLPKAANTIFERLNTPRRRLCDLTAGQPHLTPNTPLRPGDVLVQPLASDIFTAAAEADIASATTTTSLTATATASASKAVKNAGVAGRIGKDAVQGAANGKLEAFSPPPALGVEGLKVVDTIPVAKSEVSP